MNPLFIVLLLLVALVLFVVMSYNGMIKLRNRCQEAWSDIDVQLKRRYNLIPNLVETVKGYAAHEEGVFTKVTEARSQAINATNIKDQGQAENMLSGALKSLFAVAENYPDLKANQNFAQLQNELVDTEDKIQAARRFYNGVTRDFNTKIQQFPASVIANAFKFTAREFFELDDEKEKEVVQVSFNKGETMQAAAPVEPTPTPTPAPTPAESTPAAEPVPPMTAAAEPAVEPEKPAEQPAPVAEADAGQPDEPVETQRSAPVIEPLGGAETESEKPAENEEPKTDEPEEPKVQ